MHILVVSVHIDSLLSILQFLFNYLYDKLYVYVYPPVVLQPFLSNETENLVSFLFTCAFLKTLI